jgi:hypothetical protein
MYIRAAPRSADCPSTATLAMQPQDIEALVVAGGVRGCRECRPSYKTDRENYQGDGEMRVFTFLIIIVCVCLSNSSHADIIVPSRSLEYFNGGLSSSLELIYSIEKTLTKKKSVLLWGGGGFIKPARKPRAFKLGDEWPPGASQRMLA